MNDQQISYGLRKSKRAKRLQIKISAEKIEVVVPYGVKQKIVDDFITKNRAWVSKKWRKIREIQKEYAKKQPEYKDGKNILYQGIEHKISIIEEEIKTAQVLLENKTFQIFLPKNHSKDEQEIKKILGDFLYEKFSKNVEEIMLFYINKSGLRPKNHKIKFQKTLWGSCSSRGNINLNFNLVFAPINVLKYVIIHELCHLKHQNHSKKFWDLVESFFPNYKTARNWLRKHHYIINFY